MASLLALAACGGDDGEAERRDGAAADVAPIDSAGDSADPDLGADLGAGDGSSLDGPTDMMGPAPLERAAILTSGGGAGFISLIDIATLAATPDVQAAPGNATARYTNGRLHIVDRIMESVTIREVDAGLTLHKTFSIGSGSAIPQDICCTGPNRCYVPRLADPDMLIVDPQAALEVVGSIDLSSLDVDGNPNAYTCQRYLGELFVGLKHLIDPGQTARTPGRIAVIDLGTETVTGSFDTPTAGPFTRIQMDGDGPTGWIGEAGLTGIADGALVDLDLATPSATESQVNETDLDANLYRFAVCDSGEAWVIDISLTPPGPPVTSLRKADLVTGTVDPPLYSTAGAELGWIAADEMNRIWVADRSAAPGIRVWNCDGTLLSPDPNPISVGTYAPNAEGTITFIP